MVEDPGFRAAVTKEHDGDTTTFLIDNWFGSRAEESLRLAEVNAPETSPLQPGGRETRDFVNAWYARRPVTKILRWPFWIVTILDKKVEPDQRRTFVRYAAYVYDVKTRECLNTVVNSFLAEHPDWPTGRSI